MLEKNLHLIAGLYLIILFDHGAVDPDIAPFGGLLDFVTRGIFDEVHQKFIDAQRLLSLGGHEPVVLKKFVVGFVTIF